VQKKPDSEKKKGPENAKKGKEEQTGNAGAKNRWFVEGTEGIRERGSKQQRKKERLMGDMALEKTGSPVNRPHQNQGGGTEGGQEVRDHATRGQKLKKHDQIENSEVQNAEESAR